MNKSILELLGYQLTWRRKKSCDRRVLGLARWHSPYKIWLVDVGIIPPRLPFFVSRNMAENLFSQAADLSTTTFLTGQVYSSLRSDVSCCWVGNLTSPYSKVVFPVWLRPWKQTRQFAFCWLECLWDCCSTKEPDCPIPSLKGWQDS